MKTRLLPLLLSAAFACPSLAADNTTTTATTAPAALPVTVTDFLGVWRDATTHRALVIDPLYPDEPAKSDQVAARTQDHRTGAAESWGGLFIAAHGDKPGRVTFQRSPQLEEMNPAIPDWAKQKLLHELTWYLELDVDDSNPFNPQLKGNFYPGEVQWSDDAKTAKVAGKGKPIPITYIPDPNTPLEGLAAPLIEFDYKNRDALTHSLPRYLVRGDNFRILVTLPGEMAKKQEEKLNLTFHALTSGGTATVELESNPILINDVTASYTHPDEITIASRGMAGPDREPLFGLFPSARGFGPRLNLTTKNGETVEMSAASATYRFRVFDNVNELALARRIDGIQDLMLPMAAKLAASTNNAEKEDITKRIRMARTALEIGADDNLASEVRLACMDEYLAGDGQSGLLLQSGLHWIPASDPKALVPNRFGTLWTAAEEEIAIVGPQSATAGTYFRQHEVQEYVGGMNNVSVDRFDKAQDAYKRKVMDFFQVALAKETAFAMYDLVVDQTGVETALIAFAGIDRFGHRVPLSDRILTVVSWTANQVVNTAVHNLTQSDPIRRTVRNEAPSSVTPLLAEAPGADLPADMRPKLGRTSPAAAPGGTGAPQGPYMQTQNAPAANSPTRNGKFMPAGDQRSPVEIRNPPPTQCRAMGRPDAARGPDLTGTNRGPNRGTKVLEFDETQYQQIDANGCTAAAVEAGMADRKINLRQELLVEGVQEQRGLMPAGGNRPPLSEGIRYEEASQLLTEAGIANASLKYKDSLPRTVMNAYDKGLVVVVALRYPEGNLHSVAIKGFNRNAAGQVTAVWIYDPGPGDTRLLTPQQFDGYLRATEAVYQQRAAVALVIAPDKRLIK